MKEGHSNYRTGAFVSLKSVAGHAALTFLLFWTLFLFGSVSTSLLQYLAVGYAAIIVTVRAFSPADSRGASPDTAVRYIVYWGFLYPVSVAVLNAIGFWLLEYAVETPALETLPLVGTVLSTWTVWDATGLVLLAVLLTVAAMAAAVANVGGRLVSAALASPD